MLAIERNPNNARAHHWYALHHLFKGDYKDSLEEWKKAKQLDPLSLIIGSAFGYTLVRTGSIEQGLEMQRKAIELDDSFIIAHRNLASAFIIAGKNSEAVEEARTLLSLSKERINRAAAACVLAKAGPREEATIILNSLLTSDESQYIDPASLAMVFAALGKENEALDWFGKAVDEKSSVAPYVQIQPYFDYLTDNPRFKAIIKKMGL